MIYILAGPDGAGKSTTFKHLEEVFQNENFLFGKGYPLDAGELPKRLGEFETLANSRLNVIYDRFPLIDDLVYAEIIHGVKSEVLKGVEEVKRFFEKNVVVIYMNAETSVLEKRLGIRGDEFIFLKDVSRIQKAYQEAFELLGIKPVVVDTDDEINVTLKKVEDIIRERARSYKGLIHIPSLAHLNDVRTQEKHMCLAHLVLENEEYAEFYKNEANAGKQLILDNGVAEDSRVTLDEYVKAFEMVNPTEVVLQDEMGNSQETVRLTKESFEYLKPRLGNVRYMAVTHGETWEDWKWCVDRQAELGAEIIGVPKLLTYQFGHGARREAVEYITSTYPNLEIHLLGNNGSFREPISLMKDFKQVKSCDTGMALLLAEDGAEVSLDVGRPERLPDLKSRKNEKNYKEYIIKLTAMVEEELRK